MNHLRNLLCCAVIIGFIACNNTQHREKRIKQDKPTFVLDSLIDSLTLPSLSDTAGAKIRYSARIFYPVFSGEFEWLNREVDQMLLMETEVDSIKQPRIKNYYASYRIDFQEYARDSGSIDWYIDNGCSVDSITDSLIFISQACEVYCGGAHPSHHASMYVFNYKTKRKLGLCDFLKSPTDTLAIREMALSELRKIKELKPGQQLDNDAFMFINDETFSLSRNFYFTDSTLTFFYNEYEVQAYAYGYLEIPLSRNKLKNYLK